MCLHVHEICHSHISNLIPDSNLFGLGYYFSRPLVKNTTFSRLLHFGCLGLGLV